MKEMDQKLTTSKLKRAQILPEAIQTVLDIQSWLEANPERTLESYGHSVGTLSQVIVCGEKQPYDQQVVELKKKAQYLVQKYGDHIIEFMRPELRNVLGFNEDAK